MIAKNKFQFLFQDTIHSAMSVITRLCSKMEPNDSIMPECSASLGALLEHDDPKVSFAKIFKSFQIAIRPRNVAIALSNIRAFYLGIGVCSALFCRTNGSFYP